MVDPITLTFVVTVFIYLIWLYLNILVATTAGACVYAALEYQSSEPMSQVSCVISLLYLFWLLGDPTAALGALCLGIFDYVCLYALLPVWKDHEDGFCPEKILDRFLTEMVDTMEAGLLDAGKPLSEASIMKNSLESTKRRMGILKALTKEYIGEQRYDKDQNLRSTHVSALSLRQRLMWGIRDQAKANNLWKKIEDTTEQLEKAINVTYEVWYASAEFPNPRKRFGCLLRIQLITRAAPKLPKSRAILFAGACVGS